MSKILFIIALGCLLVGCRERRDEKTLWGEVKRVAVKQVGYDQVSVVEQIMGTVISKERAVLSSKISGTVSSAPIVLGQSVEKGKLLIKFDAKEILSKLNQANAQWDQAKADWKRIDSLYNQGASTKSERDRMLSQLRSAEAMVLEAKSMESYTKIEAPFSGVITRKFVNEGDLAVAGSNLLEIEDLSHLQVEANVPESLISHLFLNQKIKAEISGRDYDLIVREMSPSADRDSHTFRVKADVLFHEKLETGLFARVSIPSDFRSGLMIPSSAVIHKGQLDAVFVYTDGRANLRYVRTHLVTADLSEILSGLDEGELLIESPLSLQDGESVEVKK